MNGPTQSRDLEPQTYEVTVADGTKIFVRDYASPDPRRGLPVVCLHGLTRNSKAFSRLAPELAHVGRRTLALDVRGRGRSSWSSDSSRYRPSVYADDVIQVLTTLGITRAVFVGTSMGGSITMHVAAAAPSLVAAAVLNDIGPSIDVDGVARALSRVGLESSFPSWEAMRESVKAVHGSAKPLADDRYWDSLIRQAAVEGPDGRIVFDYDPAIRSTLIDGTGLTLDMRDVFAALAPIPVLILHGEISDLFTAAGVTLAREIKPDVVVVDVPGVGHAPTLAEPESRSAISAFMARVP